MKAIKVLATAVAAVAIAAISIFGGCARGADGRDGQDVSIYEIYEATNAARVEEGLETLSFLEFISEYLSYDGTEAEQLVSMQTAINRSLLSAVSVSASFRVQATPPYAGSEQATSLGSGVILEIDKEEGDMYVVTNCHVVYDDSALDSVISSNVEVYLYGQESSDYAIPATVIGASLTYDIAVLKVTGSDIVSRSDAMAASWTKSESVNVGQTVYAVGNAGGIGLSATTGIVSVDSEYIELSMGSSSDDSYRYRTIRTSVPIYSGNSGGGLYNAGGELIGIINSKTWAFYSGGEAEYADNVSNALPASVVRRVAESMIDRYEDDGAAHTDGINRVTLGITVQAASSRALLDNETNLVNIVETVEVTAITSGTPAYGVLKTGDVITAASIVGSDGSVKESIPVTRIFNVSDLAIAVRYGDSVVYTIERDGEEMEVTITIPSTAFSIIW